MPAQVATAPRARRLQPVQRLPPAREDQQAADAPSQGERRRELRQDAGDSSPDGDGLRRRRNLRGNTISTDTRQLNLKVLEYGKKSLGSILGDEEDVPIETTSNEEE